MRAIIGKKYINKIGEVVLIEPRTDFYGEVRKGVVKAVVIDNVTYIKAPLFKRKDEASGKDELNNYTLIESTGKYEDNNKAPIEIISEFTLSKQVKLSIRRTIFKLFQSTNIFFNDSDRDIEDISTKSLVSVYL